MAKKRLWKTASYKPGDEAQLPGLVDASAATPFDDRRWRYLFQEGADSVHIEFAWHGKKLVGQYAVVPVPMVIDGREATWCISLDTASHPDYRRQGMFTTLARALYAKLAKADVEVVFGLPNEQSSFGFYKRLDWVRVQPHLMTYMPGAVTSGMRKRLGPVAPVASGLASVLARVRGPAERAVARIASGGSAVVCEDALPDGIDALCAAELAAPGIRIRMDVARLTWRYLRHPQFHYRFVSVRSGGHLAGLAVIRPPQAGAVVGTIMDVLLADSDDLATAVALVAGAVGHLHNSGATSISALSTSGTPLRRAMQLLGFLPMRPKRGDWTWSLGARVLGGQAVPGDVYDGRQWHIGLGIHDQL